MITLITGVPGSGKTLMAVLIWPKKVDKEMGWSKKYLFTESQELTIPTEPIPDGHTIQDMHVWL